MQISSESIQEQIPYYLSQSAKENLVRALGNFPRKIDNFVNKYSDEVLQGDGWTAVEVIRFEDGARKAIKAVLLSNSCDIAPENKRELPTNLAFASLVKLASYQNLLIQAGLDKHRIEDKLVAIKEQRVSSLIYFPKGAGLDEDYVALLDDIHTVPFRAFESKADRKKIFTLSDVGFYLFVLKLSVHFCRLHEEVARG